MLKFEFVVTGVELTDSQKEKISFDFPALVTKAIAAEGDAGRFWCMCKLNGRAIFAQEQPLRPAESPCEKDRPIARMTCGDDQPAVPVFDLV